MQLYESKHISDRIERSKKEKACVTAGGGISQIELKVPPELSVDPVGLVAYLR